MHNIALFSAVVASVAAVAHAVNSQAYTWQNVKIGGGGGFVPGIIFNPSQKGLAYVRTDIGGAYRMNADHTWTPLLDFADHARWNYWGVDALATDPVEPRRLYLVRREFYTFPFPGLTRVMPVGHWGMCFTHEGVRYS